MSIESYWDKTKEAAEAIVSAGHEVLEETGDDMLALKTMVTKLSYATIELEAKECYEEAARLKDRLAKSVGLKLEKLLSQKRFFGESASEIARKIGMDFDCWSKRLRFLGNTVLVVDAIEGIYHALHDDVGPNAKIADLVTLGLTLVTCAIVGTLLVVTLGESMLALSAVAAADICVHDLFRVIDSKFKHSHNWR